MSEQLKLCPFCPSLPIERPDSYIPGDVACPMGHTSPMLKSEWNLRQPPADAKWPKRLECICHSTIKCFCQAEQANKMHDQFTAELRRVGVI